MAKQTAEFTRQNTERAMQAANVGIDWMRELAEQTLAQSRAAVDGMLTVTRKAAEGLDHQTSAVRKHSLALAESTLSNTFDLGHKVAHVREPQELVAVQCEFVSRQAEMIAEQTRGIARTVAHGAADLTDTTVRETRKQSEVA